MSFLIRGIFLVWGGVFLSAFCSWGESPIPPTRPRPVEVWQVPPRPAERQGSVIPDIPSGRKIQPLRPPRSVEGPVFGNRPLEPLPEPPVVSESEGRYAPLTSPPRSSAKGSREFFENSIHPIVLSPERYLSVTGRGVALREGPGIDFRKVATLYEGDLLEWKDTDDEWHEVEIASGTRGWVAGNLTEEVPQRVAVVTGEKVNLRDAPSDQSRILGSLYRGAVVIAMEIFGEWTQVRTPNLRNVYIATEYLEMMGEHEIPPFPLRPFPDEIGRVASLACLGSTATGELEYFLGVRPGDWVKGGKVGLIYFSEYTRPFFSADSEELAPRFVSGVFFERLLYGDEFSTGFPGVENLPEATSSILVGYLRGQKKNQVWTFSFRFIPGDSSGQFALCCQEGEHAGCYLLLETKQME